MQDFLLLIIRDSALRRLYHGLLLNQGIEVIPASNIENGLVIQTVQYIPTVVLYPDDLVFEDVYTYIKLQTTFPKFLHTELAVLTSQTDSYLPFNLSRLHTIDIAKENPLEVVTRIISCYDNHA